MFNVQSMHYIQRVQVQIFLNWWIWFSHVVLERHKTHHRTHTQWITIVLDIRGSDKKIKYIVARCRSFIVCSRCALRRRLNLKRFSLCCYALVNISWYLYVNTEVFERRVLRQWQRKHKAISTN